MLTQKDMAIDYVETRKFHKGDYPTLKEAIRDADHFCVVFNRGPFGAERALAKRLTRRKAEAELRKWRKACPRKDWRCLIQVEVHEENTPYCGCQIPWHDQGKDWSVYV